MNGLERAAILMLDPESIQHIDSMDIPDEFSLEHQVIFFEGFRKLSNDALDIVELICEPPQDLSDHLATLNSKKLTLGKITEYLRHINPKRWKHRIIQAAFNEIREVLQ